MKNGNPIDQYIDAFPPTIQEILSKIREIAKEIIPQGEESISYGIPTIKLHGKYVVYFAGYKKHISVYPVIHEDKELQEKTAPYKKGRGTLQFPLDKEIPYELIRQVIKALLEENLKRTGKY